MFKTGRIVYGPPDEGGGTGGATQPANAPDGGVPANNAAHPEAPWGTTGVWTLGEGDKAAPWWNALPDEAARKHVEAKGYGSPAELALANLNLTRLQRGSDDVVAVPAKDASPEQMREFYRKLGAPDTQDGYLDALKFDESVKDDPGMMDFAKTTFYEAGLTPSQASLIGNAWNKYVAEANAKYLADDNAANEADMKALEQRWGADLEVNKAAGRRVVDALGLSNELIDRIDQNIGTAAIVELLATIGRKSDEGGFTTGDRGDPNDPTSMTKEQANAKITELQADAEFQKKFTDAKHPEHAEAVKYMERLFART